jgi:hypothetical protein
VVLTSSLFGLALAANAAFGVADPAQRFSPVPAPTSDADPCRDRGVAGSWVKMSADGAPASIHDQSWLDSATVWNGKGMVVAVRKDGRWNGTAFDPCRNAWSTIPETRELARAEPWLAENDRPFRPSHAHGSSDGFEKIAVWDTSRNGWVTVTTDRPLKQRGHYAVALADRRLFVWGGWAQTMSVLGDGAVLDLARKAWKPMSAAGAPSPRLAPTAVAWTGSRLIVWGGRVSGAPGSFRTLGDGAQYDPKGDRWTPIAAENAPSPRTEATVVWTGRKLVVAGGSVEPGGPRLPDGGIYDPAANRWTRIAPPPGDILLPKENVGPLTRIIVLSDGRVVFLPDNLGKIAVLDADRASWSILAADELGKRNSFRAFLAGRRLIVWGGVTVIAEHICPPPIPGQPICDSWAERAPRNDGWMMLLPK